MTLCNDSCVKIIRQTGNVIRAFHRDEKRKQKTFLEDKDVIKSYGQK